MKTTNSKDGTNRLNLNVSHRVGLFDLMLICGAHDYLEVGKPIMTIKSMMDNIARTFRIYGNEYYVQYEDIMKDAVQFGLIAMERFRKKLSKHFTESDFKLAAEELNKQL